MTTKHHQKSCHQALMTFLNDAKYWNIFVDYSAKN